MLELISVRYAILGLLAAGVFFLIWWNLYPKPLPGIPYNIASANRILGDIPDITPLVKENHQFSKALFALTTQKLGTPIAQLLFPGIRRPMIILDEPREIEDILLRRSREFDKSSMSHDIFTPMFPHGSVSQYTTPELKAQKRLWADVMKPEFLRRTAAPTTYKATCDLLESWKIKATTLYKDQPFAVLEDFKSATLDVIWFATVGEDSGLVRYEIQQLQNQISGKNQDQLDQSKPPPGIFLKEEVNYIGETINRNANTVFPKWAQKLETYTPRYRKCRRLVNQEMIKAIERVLDRYQNLEIGLLESDDIDTCAVDLVLRREVLSARKAGKPLMDPTKNARILDELFALLTAGHDSTANTLAWFVRFMELNPSIQTRLRTTLQEAFPGPEPPTVYQILDTDIPYLDAACEEGMRLAGTSLSHLRQATVDTQILGYRVPKGTEIFMNFHIDHAPAPIEESRRSSGSREAAQKHGDGIKGPAGHDLGSFEPRRWLSKDPNTGKETFNAYALPSLNFGGGYRGCFGRKLAMLEFRIMVVLMILNFEFLELPPEFRSMAATEKIFRHPDMPHIRVKVL